MYYIESFKCEYIVHRATNKQQLLLKKRVTADLHCKEQTAVTVYFSGKDLLLFDFDVYHNVKLFSFANDCTICNIKNTIIGILKVYFVESYRIVF